MIIQELNLRVNRNIPFIRLDCVEYVTEHTRIIIRDSEEFDDENILLSIDDKMSNFTNITHNIDCFQAAGRAILEKTSIIVKNIDMTILFDYMIRNLTIIDILLDIAFFNSYSFLKNLKLSDKKLFSKRKYDFFRSQGLPTVFEETTANDLDYYSFAFSCHKPNISDDKHYEYEICINKYIEIWDRFLDMYYPGQTHREDSVQDQILNRRNKHISDTFYKKFNNRKPGVYYIIRKEKKSTPDKYKPIICSLFGFKDSEKRSVGRPRIIEAKDFDNYSDLFLYANVSAFKIVIQ